MKRFLIILSAMVFITIQPVMAKGIKVQAMGNFSTANPSKTWAVQLVDNVTVNDGTVYYAGSVIYGNIVGVTDPKRLKRNATFTFVPTKYYDSKTEKYYNVKRNFEGRYSSRSDLSAGSVIKTGAVAAGNHFISGFIGPGIALVEGVVKNEEGNRAKSAVVSVYESTPLSYVNKGKELELKKGQVFVMNFNLVDEEEEAQNLPNYSYTIEK